MEDRKEQNRRRWWKRIILWLLLVIIMAILVVGAVLVVILTPTIFDIEWTSNKVMILCIVIFLTFFAAVIFWRRRKKGETIVYSYSDIVFLTPFVLVGFAMGPISNMGWLNPETCAWIWIVTAIFCILAVCRDMGKIHIGFLLVLVIVLPLANFFLKSKIGIDVLGDIHRFLADMDIVYQGSLRNAGFVLSMVFGIIIPCSILWTKLDHPYKIESLTVRRFRFPAGTPVVISETRNADSCYPNFLKTVMGLFGDVVIQSPFKTYIIRNVPRLPFIIKEIQDKLQTIPTKEVSR